MKIRSALAAAAMIAGSLVGIAGVATPASADYNCFWYANYAGDWSNCDNLSPLHCSQWEYAKEQPLGGGIVVALKYSRVCRTVSAELRVNIGDLTTDSSNCYVKVERNSDGEILRAGVYQRSRFPNTYTAGTNMLYDSNVTSFAWGYCRLSNGAVYSGRTESW